MDAQSAGELWVWLGLAEKPKPRAFAWNAVLPEKGSGFSSEASSRCWPRRRARAGR